MRNIDPPRHFLAIGLAAQAGLVDALGFLKLGGLFVSFMSGNSTRMAVSAAAGSAIALNAAALIGAFVAGVVAGALVGRAADAWRKPAVLGLGLALLLLAALQTLSGPPGTSLTLLMAAAMGVVNNVFQRDGEVSVGVTYMTGTLVKLGQQIAAALMGGDALCWLPYLWLWLGLVAGAVSGALLFATMDLQALWIACLWCTLLLVWSIRLGPVESPRDLA